MRYPPRGYLHDRPGGLQRRYGIGDHRLAVPTQHLGSWLDGHSHPEPDPHSILLLKDADAQPACSNLHLSTEEAFGRAFQAIEKYQRTRFVCLAPGKRHIYPTHKLPFLVFDQLDREIFRSVLKGNVHLRWSAELPNGIYATTRKPDPGDIPRITIFLSKFLAEAGRVDIFCTLVHQMIHAYFLQCCGYQTQDGRGRGHDLCHGPEFRALLVTIGNRWFIEGHRSTSRLANPLPTPSDVRPMLRRRGSPRASWSNCYATVSLVLRGVGKTDDRNWRNLAITKVRSLEDKTQPLPIQQLDVPRALERLFPIRDGTPPFIFDLPMPVKPRSPGPLEPNFFFIDPETSSILPPRPRSQYPLPPEFYIELHFKSSVFPLARGLIAPHLPGLAQSPCFTDERILTLPTWSDLRDLVLLYAFLCTPSNSSLATRSDPAQFPIIGTYNPKSSAMVKSHVSVYHLALAMEFIPLVIHAVDMLKSLRCTHENPIAVLENIYHPPGFIPQISMLRDWTKSWLALRIPHDEGWEDYAAEYPTNLSVVKDHPDWKTAYVTLREKGTVLVTDLDAVEAEIAKSQEATYEESNGQPIPRQHPSSAPFPFYLPALPSGSGPTPAHDWHDMAAGKDIQAEEKMWEERKWREILYEEARNKIDGENRRKEKNEQAWKQVEEEDRRKRKDDEAQKKIEEAQKQIHEWRDQRQKRTDDDALKKKDEAARKEQDEEKRDGAAAPQKDDEREANKQPRAQDAKELLRNPAFV